MYIFDSWLIAWFYGMSILVRSFNAKLKIIFYSYIVQENNNLL